MTHTPEHDNWLDGLVRDALSAEEKTVDANAFLARLHAAQGRASAARRTRLRAWLVPAAAAAALLLVASALVLRTTRPAHPPSGLHSRSPLGGRPLLPVLAECSEALQDELDAAWDGARVVSSALADATRESLSDMPAPRAPDLNNMLPAGSEAASRLRNAIKSSLPRIPLTTEET